LLFAARVPSIAMTMIDEGLARLDEYQNRLDELRRFL
jgi:hypothetical protein